MATRQAPKAGKRPETSLAQKQKTARQRLGHIDIPMLTIVMILLMFGLVMLYSASYANGLLRYNNSNLYIGQQVRYAVVGVIGMFAAALIDYHVWRKFAWPIMAVTLVLLAVVLFMAPYNGARRWIWIGSGQSSSFQPSEIAKFALILLFASLMAKNEKRMKDFKHGFLPYIIILCMVAGLLILEPHLSCTILVLGIGLIMMFVGGTSLRWFGFAAVAGAAALVAVLVFVPDAIPYAMKRITNWLSSMEDVSGMTHQTYQSLIAIGSGGITGRGIGNSRQKFLYLPEMHNDYIFAVLCEELGLIGALVVIALFLLLLARGLYIAVRARDKFGTMLVVGISVQIALQAFLHIAVNTNAIPSTGISLPFFSSGGTSLCMLLGQMGIVLSVSRGADATLAAKQPGPDTRDKPAPPGKAGDTGPQKPPQERVGYRA